MKILGFAMINSGFVTDVPHSDDYMDALAQRRDNAKHAFLRQERLSAEPRSENEIDLRRKAVKR